MFGKLALLKYVKSFSDGRVRIRHPALHKENVAKLVKDELESLHGVTSVEFNVVSGSVLILYDSAVLSKDRLIEMGVEWGAYLDAVQSGHVVKPPQFL